jgi:hypothetical protein
MPKQPCVYILASQPNGTIYVGVSSDLIARLVQHRSGESANPDWVDLAVGLGLEPLNSRPPLGGC